MIAGGGSAVITGRNPEKLQAAVEALSKHGKAWGIAAELTDRAQIPEARRRIADEHADASLLVNGAGIFVPKPSTEYDEDFYDSFHELNRAMFFITRTVVAGMLSAGNGGSIVNIGAMWAHQGIAATPHTGFSVQKGGLHSQTKALAIELAPHAIRVNAVSPAAVRTPPYYRLVTRRTSRTP
ncbi:SDR family oxidoreductase [Amycolatopsis sp. NPDC023774]|uniref:SDR family NAD(P)-dependent oxidoreductase n=1 Tax=Amycolatopsis sp. NPDC023774 TaxID=3155015 RepID=UPI0033E1CC1D